MKKILGLGVVALLVMGLVGGGTWAYFNDVETSSGNILTAGTLNLGLANSANGTQTGSSTGTWTTPSGWKPGNTANATLYAANTGTIDMSTVNITFAYSITNGTPTSVSSWNGTANTDKLEKMIKITTATWGGVSVPALVNQTLEDLATSNTLLGSLANGIEKGLNIVWTFDTTASNGCQGDSANITATLTGIQ
ncbi:MAG: hypothetical protein HW402_95 [Dehalococcoidales bacterium]|nr:hypothetical protein [Dehalococcoidales bacterium]